jgi:hypothetical protein
MRIEVGYVLVRRQTKGYWLATTESSTNKDVAQRWMDLANRGRKKPLYKLGTITIEVDDEDHIKEYLEE